MVTQAATSHAFAKQWREFLGLCKLKVVALIVFTSIVGMLLAVPGWVPLDLFIFGNLGIGMAAAAAAAINHIVDQQVDAKMARTQHRPLVTGSLTNRQALIFATGLAVLSMFILVMFVNLLTALLTFASLIGYAVVYTMYLKRATPQNIVIGGAAGAAPPVLGWAAVTGTLDPQALLLFLIVFVWTPPHFWALAVARREEYARADVPMLPVTHGVAFTQTQIILYTLLLVVVSALPYVTRMSGLFYFGGAMALGAGFLVYALQMKRTNEDRIAMKTFAYSIFYLMGIFAFLLIDHYIAIVLGQFSH